MICTGTPSNILIVGSGASGREIAWLAREAFGPNVAMRYAVETRFLTGEEPVDGVPVYKLEELEPLPSENFVIAVGDGLERERLDAVCSAMRLEPIAIVHPQVIMSARVSLAPGAIVYPGTVLTTDITVGRHCHINSGCTISHDVDVGDFATLSPGVRVAGHVRIGKTAFLGIGAVVVNGRAGQPIEIGARSKILAGACVTKSVGIAECVAGVPAKVRT